MSEPTMYTSTNATTSPSTSTSALKYTISFQPSSVGNYTPDIIVFKNVSNLNKSEMPNVLKFEI